MKKLSKEELLQISPLAMAYIGDAVYELHMRCFLMSGHYKNINDLHHRTVAYVKAAAQRKILQNIEEKLSDAEKDIVRRGRNANPHTVPKNADIADYRYATGFEALIGYLYLSGEEERLKEILGLCEVSNG